MANKVVIMEPMCGRVLRSSTWSDHTIATQLRTLHFDPHQIVLEV